MEYSINSLAKMCGISTRTLRYYDEIGLLKPKRLTSNGYRVYSQAELDRLEQILYLKALDISLGCIKKTLNNNVNDTENLLKSHLNQLILKRDYINNLIINIEKSISAQKEGLTMNNEEKFKVFKQNIIDQNNQKYGEELFEKYGSTEKSDEKFMRMSKQNYEKQEKLAEEIINLLKISMKTNDPLCETSIKMCNLHKDWLCMFWEDGMYSPAIHNELAQMYILDERFTKYYDDKAGKGATKFLVNAINEFTK